MPAHIRKGAPTITIMSSVAAHTLVANDDGDDNYKACFAPAVPLTRKTSSEQGQNAAARRFLNDCTSLRPRKAFRLLRRLEKRKPHKAASADRGSNITKTLQAYQTTAKYVLRKWVMRFLHCIVRHTSPGVWRVSIPVEHTDARIVVTFPQRQAAYQYVVHDVLGVSPAFKRPIAELSLTTSVAVAILKGFWNISPSLFCVPKTDA
jgi:hypothetical protein